MKYRNKWVEEIVKKENGKFLFFWGHQALKNGEIGNHVSVNGLKSILNLKKIITQQQNIG